METIKIFITTDNHLGFKEKHPIQSTDSFDNFREALSIAQNNKVDFIFLLGDLFHENKPTLETFSQACQILMENTGIKKKINEIYDCNDLSFIQETKEAIPVLTINGNHD